MKTKMRLFTKLAFVAILSIGIASCTDDDQDEDQPAAAATNDDAAAEIEESLQKSNGGLAKDMDQMVLHMPTALGGQGVLSNLECNTALDTSVSYTLSGSATGSYEHIWNLFLTCTDNIPQILTIIATYTGEFNGNNVERQAAGNRNWIWTGLGPQFDEFTLNGNGARSVVRTFLNPGFVVSWNINWVLDDVTYNKENQEISGGTGTATAIRTASNGSTQTFIGDVVFNGDGTATVTINGNIYTVTL